MPTRTRKGNSLTRQSVLNGLPAAGRRTPRVLPQPSASPAVSVEGLNSRPQGREER